jgi:hypothetical protein
VHPDSLHGPTWTNLYDAQILNGKVAGLMLALTQMLSASDAVSRPGSPICKRVQRLTEIADRLDNPIMLTQHTGHILGHVKLQAHIPSAAMATVSLFFVPNALPHHMTFWQQHSLKLAAPVDGTLCVTAGQCSMPAELHESETTGSSGESRKMRLLLHSILSTQYSSVTKLQTP